MKKFLVGGLILILCFTLAACEDDGKMMYENITAEEAKTIMDTESGYVILDVRTQEEFDSGHIPGAIVIPYEKIEELATEKLPDKDTLLLVYCRSGRRSKIAAETLANMGYTNIKEFGGIIHWPYNTEKQMAYYSHNHVGGMYGYCKSNFIFPVVGSCPIYYH